MLEYRWLSDRRDAVNLTRGIMISLSTSGPSVHGISQARILEWVAMSSSKGSS